MIWLIWWFDMTSNVTGNKKLNPVGTELSIKGRILNISMVFIKLLYFPVPKDVVFNTTHFLSWWFQIEMGFNKLLLIIYLILTSKTLWCYTENVLKNIHFLWLILPFHQIIHYMVERIFRWSIESNHDHR